MKRWLLVLGMLCIPAAAHADGWLYTWWCPSGDVCGEDEGHHTEGPFATQEECLEEAAVAKDALAAIEGAGATDCYVEGESWDFREDDEEEYTPPPTTYTPTDTSTTTWTPPPAPASRGTRMAIRVGFELGVGGILKAEDEISEQTGPVSGGLSAGIALGPRTLHLVLDAGLRFATLRHPMLEDGAIRPDMFLPLTIGVDVEPKLGRSRWRALLGGSVGAAIQFPCGACTGSPFDQRAAAGFEIRSGFTRYSGKGNAFGVRIGLGVSIYQFKSDDPARLDLTTPPVSLRFELVQRKNDD